ncbi:MAG: glycosyltransferase family 2 protein [Candidatus Bathyarchaeia archaeon]
MTKLSGEQTSGILVSIIIPAFNEEKNLGNVLAELHKLDEQVQMDHEVIVVDDGSTDKTKEVAIRNGAKVLSNKTNQGKGCSLKCGFEYARGEIIVTMDADGSHNPEDIGKLISPVLNGADVAVGSRFNTDEGKKTTTRVNLFGNHLINLLILIMTGSVVTDSQSGFRAYKSTVLKETVVTSKGYAVDTELTLKSIINGYSLKEVPILVRKRANGCSRLNPIRDGLRILKVIIQSVMINN